MTEKDRRDLRPLTIPEAAGILGIGRNQGYEAARSGQIPTIRIGRRLLVPRPAFERLLEEGTQERDARAEANASSKKPHPDSDPGRPL